MKTGVFQIPHIINGIQFFFLAGGGAVPVKSFDQHFVENMRINGWD